MLMAIIVNYYRSFYCNRCENLDKSFYTIYNLVNLSIYITGIRDRDRYDVMSNVDRFHPHILDRYTFDLLIFDF